MGVVSESAYFTLGSPACIALVDKDFPPQSVLRLTLATPETAPNLMRLIIFIMMNYMKKQVQRHGYTLIYSIGRMMLQKPGFSVRI